MKKKVKQGGRGGARPGSGRKALPPGQAKVSVSIKLPPWMITWMGEQTDNRTTLIEQAVIKAHKLKGMVPK